MEIVDCMDDTLSSFSSQYTISGSPQENSKLLAENNFLKRVISMLVTENCTTNSDYGTIMAFNGRLLTARCQTIQEEVNVIIEKVINVKLQKEVRHEEYGE